MARLLHFLRCGTFVLGVASSIDANNMTDSSKIAADEEMRARDVSGNSDSVTPAQASPGSSKLQLPTTKQHGSSVAKSANQSPTDSAPNSGFLPITDQPTSISKKPAIAQANNTASLGTLVRTLVGTEVQHFHIDEFVGGGGMGAVFRGKDTSLGRVVAIKVLSRESIDEEMVKRFHHEARSAAKLDHPSIPSVYFVGEHDGWHFIVFEFIEGENIRDIVVKQGPLSIPDTVVFLADIAEALQHADSRDVVHRDVKPSNVLVTHDGHAKLVDMGLARTDQMQSATGDLTATGVTLGTFDYISPEQARDPREADTRSDIYSLGCTLYFMLTGRPPFPDGTMLQKLLSHTSEAPPDPIEFRDDVPPRLNDMLARMLAKNPDHRHQDASDLLGDIVFLAEEENIKLNDRNSGLVIERRVVQDTGFVRHIPWLVPLIVLVGTAIALQAFQGVQSPPPTFKRPNEVVEEVAPETTPITTAESDLDEDNLFRTDQ